MPWYKGNLHTHTTNSEDGKSSPQQLCDWYGAHGYNFLAFTDHDHITTEKEVSRSNGLLVIAGEEVSGNHLVALRVGQVINKRLPIQEKIDLVRSQGGLCIAAHPNWLYDHWPLPLLESTTGYAAIEIFNTHITALEGSAYALNKWDKLLTRGRRVWGVASDDVHDISTGRIGRGWVVVQSQELSVPAIFKALTEGDFYASNGVSLESFSMENHTVEVVARDGNEIVFVGAHGKTLKRVEASAAKYEVRGDEIYVRAECRGPQGTAFTQPMFVSSQHFGHLMPVA
jgi:predicted metal-dependent phosphoesterase TrpH